MPIYPLIPIGLFIAWESGAFGVVFLFGLALSLTWRRQSLYTHIGALVLVFLVLLQNSILSVHEAEALVFEHEAGGLVFEIESRRDNGQTVRFYGESNGMSGVLIGRDIELGRPGETCVVTFESVPFSPLRNTGGFDEEKWALGAGLSFKGKDVHVERCRPSNGLNGRMLRWKERQLERIEAMHRPDVALYMEALLFGESRLLDEETSFSYRVTGLLHLLVISGSHIALLVFALRLVFRPLPLHRETKLGLVIVCVTAFGWLTGFSPPVARAVLVADVVLILSLFGQTVRDPVRMLSWCAAALLVVQPYLLWNLGFQLTVGMTLFLLLTRSMWTNLFSVALYAQWFGLIFLWQVQPVISIFAPVYNVLAGLLISWAILPLALITYVVPSFEPWLYPILDGLNGMFQLHHLYRPWVPLHDITFWHAVYLFVALGCGLVLIDQRRSVGWVLAVVSLLALHVWLEWSENPRVTFLDVGQGDAIVVEQAGITGLIDVGGVFQRPDEQKRSTYDPGADVVVPYIWKRGETHIDFILLTHADHDHIGGLTGVLDLISVREVWLADEAADESKRQALMDKLAAYDVNVRFVKAGDRPYPWLWVVTPTDTGEDENANSVSVFMKVGGMSYLLTGDLPEEKEKLIPTVDVDVFKLGHHGAETSSGADLINRVNPEFVVVSVGANNRYGHPHLDTLARVEGRRLLRTDEDGMVVCERGRCQGSVRREVRP